MIDEIRKQLEAVPFVPFSVRTSDGHEYSVPTGDHAYITSRGNRVIVTDDKGTVAILGRLYIYIVIPQPSGASSEAGSGCGPATSIQLQRPLHFGIILHAVAMRE